LVSATNLPRANPNRFASASLFEMRYVSRHKSMDVLQAYVRDADLFRHHAGARLL
jgi:hypothetical protein